MPSAYERAFRFLNMATHGTFAERFVATGESYFGDADLERQWWKSQMLMLSEAHIFEFDPDVSFLLSITDNDATDRDPGEIKLPFPTVFLETSFKVPYRETQLQNVGVLLCSGGPIADFSHTGIPRAEHQDIATIRVPHVSVISYIYDPKSGTTADVYYPLAMDPIKLYKDHGLIPKDTKVETTKYSRAEIKALNNVTLNFLDLLQTPDVFLVPIHRERANLRRQRQGKLPLPDGSKVYVRPSIRRYIYEIKESGAWTYSHAFWVRGHFRHLRSEFWKEKRGQIIWIKPFVKGKGILIKKPYKMPGS